MVGAKGGMAEIAAAHARLTSLFATFGAGNSAGGELSTAWTFIQAIQTESLAAAV